MLKPFLQWLAITVTGFGALSGGYHTWLTQHPTRVLVVLDTSFPMQSSWPEASAALQQLRQRPYTEFSLYTEKAEVHGWQPGLNLRSNIMPYAPRDWSKLDAIRNSPEAADADEVILITNDKTYGGVPSGWKVERLP
jgi:hypothetical protein